MDCEFHQPEFAVLRARIIRSGHAKTITAILRFPLTTGFAAGKDDQILGDAAGIPQIRPTNILPDGELTFEGAKMIPADAIRPTDRLDHGDVLFNNTNSSAWVGKSAIFSVVAEAVCSNHVTRVRVRDGINPRLVVESLNVLQRQGYFRWLATNFNNQAGINNDTLANVTIPLGPAEDRERLLADLDAERTRRDAGLKAADDLLAGINGFVLDTLGLSLPPPHDPTRPFAVRLGSFRDTRFDAEYFLPRFKALRDQIDRSAFDVHELKDLCWPLRSGFAAGADDQGTVDNGIPHIRPTNISRFGEIVDAGMKFVPRDAASSSDLLGRGEVLFNNTNSTLWIGKSAVFDRDDDCACSNHVTRIRPIRPDLSAGYFAALFNALRSLGYFSVLATNFNNQSGINTEVLGQLRLPMPRPDVQRLIAAEVDRRRADAARLRAEARGRWDAARARFEEALLGPQA